MSNVHPMFYEEPPSSTFFQLRKLVIAPVIKRKDGRYISNEAIYDTVSEMESREFMIPRIREMFYGNG